MGLFCYTYFHMNMKRVYNDGTIEVKVSKHPPAWYVWARPAATCIPITKNGKLLLIDEGKGGKKNRWGFPGGMIEGDEGAKRAAQRECEEEIGLKPSRLKLVEVVKTGFPDTSVSFYLGYHLKEGKRAPWDEGIISIQEMNLTQVLRMVEEGRFHDPRTVVALLALKRKIRRGQIKLKTG